MKVIRKIAAICLGALCFIAFWRCSDDGPTPKVEPENPIDYFRKDSVYIGDGPMCGDFWYVNKIRIQDSKGNNLLDEKNPNNVREDNFYVEFGDTILHKDCNYTTKDFNTGRYTFEISVNSNHELADFLSPSIFIGEGWTGKEGLDKSFTFVWPERNIRVKVRALCRIWNDADMNWIIFQYGTLYNGKPYGFTYTIVVD